jgi:CRISPR-associated endonuclease Csn1
MDSVDLKDDLILGLDIGANSVGWAIVQHNGENPIGLIDAGVRVFEEGANYEDYLQGRPASRNADRRMARQRRRLLERTKLRMNRTLRILQEAGFLPEGQRPDGIPRTGRSPLAEVLAFHPEKNNPYKLRADALVKRLEPFQLGRVFYHLAQRRGFLSNRKAEARQKDDNKERGKVKGAIKSLRQELEAKGWTLGQYLSSLDPHERRIRGRHTSRKMYEDEFEGIWNAQSPHYPDKLTGDVKAKDEPKNFKKRLHKAIFFQRPLKSAKHLIGECELERGRPRAPMGLLLAQRVRLLQEVNHSRAWEPGMSKPRELKSDERELLLLALQSPDSLPQDAKDRLTTNAKGKAVPEVLNNLRARALLKFRDAARMFGWPEEWRFNLEAGGREEFKGDTTSARLRYALVAEDDDEEEAAEGEDRKRKNKKRRLVPIFGARWDEMLAKPSERRGQRTRTLADDVVEDVISIQKEWAQAARGKKWGLSEEQAELFGRVVLEDGYSRLSRQALEKLAPKLKEGLDFARAKAAAGYKEPDRRPVGKLPPGENLRNPIVQRAMAEVRRVVNAIVAKYGKPALVRIELFREAKKPALSRQIAWKINQQNRKDNEEAAEEITKRRSELGIDEPKARDKLKCRLLQECRGRCPYTDEPIGWTDLFRDGLFEIEHIIPFSRSLDDSYLNKTLCHVDANKRKGKLTPWEAYGGTDDWDRIIRNVENFQERHITVEYPSGIKKKMRIDAAAEKLRRFKLKNISDENAFGEELLSEFMEDFTEQKAATTAYASRMAATYVGRLYGNEWRRHVQTGSRGQATMFLRDQWDLNRILDDGGRKNRRDYRHHAIDAICVALTNPETVKMLCDAAARSKKPGRFDRESISSPWPTFLDDVRAMIDKIGSVDGDRCPRCVSHRVNRKTTGEIHKTTFYSKKIPKRGDDGRPVLGKNGDPERVFVVRTPLEKLTPPDIRKDFIVDPVVRAAVHRKLAEIVGVSIGALHPIGKQTIKTVDAQLKEALKGFRDVNNHPFLESKLLKEGEQPRQIPIHKVRVTQEVEPEEVGKAERLRRVKLGNNSHLEVFEVTAMRGRNKGKKAWKGVVVSLLETNHRKPIIRDKDNDGNPLVTSLRINEAVWLTLDKEVGPPNARRGKGERVLAVVRKLSDKEYVFKLHNDARKSPELDRDKFYAKGAESLRKMDPEKVIISPLGEIRPARTERFDDRSDH